MNKETSLQTMNQFQEKKVWLLKQLSYSSLLTYHACPRKFQLEKLQASESEDGTEAKGSVHFAFGHSVGAGIQAAFLPGATEDDCYFAAYLAWDIPLFEELEKKKKSFGYALKAVSIGRALAESLKAEGWELAFFGGEPAIEFSFTIRLPNGFKYRAYVDLILHNPKTGKFRIIEIKTTGSSFVHEATYANSAQGLSYAIVLDSLVKEHASYDVLYLVYKTGVQEFESLPFSKSRQAKAEWIGSILQDTRQISLDSSEGHFSKRGESCFNFFKACQFFGICGYCDEFLDLENEKKIDAAIEKEKGKKYQVNIDLRDILNDQLLSLETDEDGKKEID